MEQVEELLYELGRDIDLQLTDLNRLIDDELEEKFVNALKVGPSGIHFFLLLHTSLRTFLTAGSMAKTGVISFRIIR